MDFHLKQWRDHHNQQQQQHDQEESEEQQPSPAKLPRLFHLQPDNNNTNTNQDPPALPLFAPTKISTYPDSKPPLPPTLSTRGGGGHFSLSQWQELELQALIFRHMAAGSVVPPELLQIVKKSLLASPSYYLNNYAYYHQPSLLQAAGGYWGRSTMDPEPGRCRRTDGKKWRCSRDVVVGQKYCERHVHRGRNRSRKPVEFSASAGNGTLSRAAADVDAGGVFGSSQQEQSGGAHFFLSGPTPSIDIFHLNQGASEQKGDSKFPIEQESEDNGKVLRRFFEDWPANELSSPATSLSISTPVTNTSLDFLKLSTGNGEDGLSISRRTSGSSSSSNVWGGVGESQAATMGGPLAEALRSPTGSSPC